MLKAAESISAEELAKVDKVTGSPPSHAADVASRLATPRITGGRCARAALSFTHTPTHIQPRTTKSSKSAAQAAKRKIPTPCAHKELKRASGQFLMTHKESKRATSETRFLTLHLLLYGTHTVHFCTFMSDVLTQPAGQASVSSLRRSLSSIEVSVVRRREGPSVVRLSRRI